ncbi:MULTISPECIES: APC family permease [Streptosporangium]|uniref:Amino acid transporter n=1 Tax=Streptosporangium brasiliense TaxID=47480 RepID=A0ABT9RLW9_9ACTN|nr:APC family permease [Streptosporangium brasiliense]MDP9870287.1 amino acid transporter [Streptosporangium brasiliense]
MTTTLTPTERQLRGTLTTTKIVYLVIAAAAPLSALVGTLPLAFAIGNGPGVPAMFAFAGVTLLCFSVGYAAMSRHIVNAGGFYTYISCGLGRPAAVGSGLIAVMAYNTITIGLVGAFAYFAQLVAASHGVDLPWELWAAAAVAVMAVLGYRQIDLSARVLSVLIIGEIAILVLLVAAILLREGTAALPAASFAPGTVVGAGIGVSMMFAFCSFVGFESTALYGEETSDPRRSVPLATYAAVTVIAVFYALTSWVVVGAVGPSRVQEVAAAQLGNLFFGLSDDYLSKAATVTMQVLLCTSLFAAMLAMHNASNRYLFVLGRERLLPHWLQAVHPRHRSPHRASLVQTTVTVVLVAAFALVGLDPYVNLSTSMIGIGTLGVVVLQALATLSVIGFFRGRPDRHWWRTGLAPLLGFAGLAVAGVLLLDNFALMTGTTAVVVTSLPWLILAAGVAGIGYALWMRTARPERYAALAGVQRRDQAGPVAASRP